MFASLTRMTALAAALSAATIMYIVAPTSAEVQLDLVANEGSLEIGQPMTCTVIATGAAGCTSILLRVSYAESQLEVASSSLAADLTAERPIASTVALSSGEQLVYANWTAPLEQSALDLYQFTYRALVEDPDPPAVTLVSATQPGGISAAPRGPRGDERGPRVTGFAVPQNHPNPGNPGTTISFSLPEPAIVTITMYHVSGREMGTVVDHRLFPAGSHAVSWDGRDRSGRAVPPGVYFYRVDAGDHSSTTKMVVVR